MRRLLRGLAWSLGVVALALVALIAEAHWEMHRVAPEIPDGGELLAAASAAEGPVRVRYLNTATQPGSGPATVGHPAFLLEWADGRGFLIDAGMERASTASFGRLAEVAFGADSITAHGSVAEQLGDAAASVSAIAFTHLHIDHTDGLPGLCASRGGPLPVFQTPPQADRTNYSTFGGRADLEQSSCARFERLAGGPLHKIPGFPGLVALEAGGHTPGSTIFAARVGDTTWVFGGDVTVSRDALRANRPKALWYSLLMVPESRSRLERLRVFLWDLEQRPDATVLVSHDLDAVQASGMPAWPRLP